MAKSKPKPGAAPSRLTKRWTRNASDELAVKAGCRFDERRARHAVEWIETYCKLYEGEWAGEVLRLTDWQLDCTMRLFGWVRWSDRWKREIRRFREASIWVAKKNKKTPTAAAWALYLLAGDGEPGQKVFLAAKDGTQVRQNLARHTVEMLEQSGSLRAECEINKGTLQITHTPTRSTLTTLSSSNSRTQQSKEGLNGSIVVDETHVVDREFMSRVTRAGISRSEPMRIEVSTAGDNPDGYGKERFDRAVLVERGEVEDQEMFAAVYAAPQTLSDADLDADPVKWGLLANPAWGHTIDPEEFLTDYQKSKVSLTALGDFKKYRLNIWQHSSSPWLRESDWDACRRDFTAESLAGRVCWAGLDLSKTEDMTALVLAFKGDGPEEILLLPYFWMPEESARRKNHLAPFLQWAASGHLVLTPGGVVDYGFIKAQFRRAAKLFSIAGLAYDKTYAEEVTQTLEQGQTDDAGVMVEEGTGVPREIFPQTITTFAGPTADFERGVIAHTLHHAGHPILTWQARHTCVYTDPNNNRRPIKPKFGDHKKIDGIVAAIMARAKAAAMPAPITGGFAVW